MKLSRRTVLESVASFAIAEAMAGCCCKLGSSERPRIALQLYSIHKIFWQSPERILSELKAAGFDGVEFAGTAGRSSKELRKLLADAGLIGAGTHVNGDVAFVGDRLERTLEFCAEAGIRSVVTPHALRKSADEYRAFGSEMGKAAEVADSYGIKLGIHTAPFHFNTLYGNRTAWECIVSESSPLLQQEIDVGNVVKGGGNPVAVLTAGTGRHFVLHAKENDPTPHGIFGESPTDGGPRVSWDEVMTYARSDKSIEWWVIESEMIPDSLDPAKACCEKLHAWI